MLACPNLTSLQVLLVVDERLLDPLGWAADTLHRRATRECAGEGKDVENLRMLVVDDESEVLDVMVDVLKQEGYSPQATTDSREASRLLETTPFDIIVSDIMMPHLNGLELLELAKRQNPHVQVVLVTGYSTREVALEALNRGATGYIEKPFHTDQLLASVREAIWRWRLKRDPKS